MSSGGQGREVTHFHYTSWPDFGTPRTPVGFIELVRNVGGTQEGSPILVHCSAGLGRSGVFVAVHSSLEAQKSGAHRVDLATTVREMRKQRGGMIQTADQYRFCFEAVAEALDPILSTDEAPSEQTQSLGRTTSAKSDVPRPSSHPPPGGGAPHTERRKRYLQDCIPPPPSYPPPPTDHEEKPTLPEKRVSSPPPPYSSPSPPLTPSTSVETTPTKVPFVVTSPEDTPTKQSADTLPDIVVTPPTRRPSLASVNLELGSIKHELMTKMSHDLKKGEKGSSEDNGVRGQSVTSVPSSTAKPSTDKSINKPEVKSKQGSLKQEREDRRKQPPPPIKTKPSKQRRDEKEEERETIVSEEELRRTLEGFEVPPPRKIDMEPQTEEGGFEISDDQVLEPGPPPKMEVMKDKPVTTRWGVVLTQKQPPLSTARAKPQKWEPVSVSHSHVPVSSIVNRGDSVRTEDRPQKVGKLVIPSAFGSTVKPTTPPPSPKRKPVNIPSKPVKPVPEIGQPETTPPVMRMIRKIEAGKRGTPRPTNRATEPVKPVTQEQPKPVEQTPTKPVEHDSPTAPSVKALLARFENK